MLAAALNAASMVRMADLSAGGGVPNKTEQEALLRLAEDAARAAGAVLLRGVGLRGINFQSDKDVKLQADVESEALIRKMLEAHGKLPVIGEEGGGDIMLTQGSDPYWVVDPLDGTGNYLRGIPQTCVSIGLMCGLKPVLGVIYDFNADECFTALADGPLLLNGVVHKARHAESLNRAFLITGFPAGRDYSDRALAKTIADYQRFHKVRMLGSAALALAYVAAGRCDAYREESIRLWDIAAGLALLQASGCHYTLLPPAGCNQPLAYDLWAVGRAEWLNALQSGDSAGH